MQMEHSVHLLNMDLSCCVGFGNRKSLEEESSSIGKEAGGYATFSTFYIKCFPQISLLIFSYQMKIHLDKVIMNGIGELNHYHSEHRVHIMNLLNEGRLHIASIINKVEEKIGQIDVSKEQNLEVSHRAVDLDENECRDVHITNDMEQALSAKVITIILASCFSISALCYGYLCSFFYCSNFQLYVI